MVINLTCKRVLKFNRRFALLVVFLPGDRRRVGNEEKTEDKWYQGLSPNEDAGSINRLGSHVPPRSFEKREIRPFCLRWRFMNALVGKRGELSDGDEPPLMLGLPLR